MSDNESKSRGSGGKTAGWTDREILVCLLNVMEHSDCKLEYGEAPYPSGRNANGFRQKINALKRELKGEFESIKAGNPIDGTPKKKGTSGDGTPKSTSKKRKGKTDGEEGENASPKKRGRPKKNAAAAAEAEEDIDEEMGVKTEPDGDAGIGTEI
ncbi:hypothetical protein BKA63DRAFT_599873 [Paraphoma chrysanthemicola]|nr:hypothetical protein BKA63DRAFT_599873 [Paraphoma chrysanthemicola]